MKKEKGEGLNPPLLSKGDNHHEKSKHGFEMPKLQQRHISAECYDKECLPGLRENHLDHEYEKLRHH